MPLRYCPCAFCAFEPLDCRDLFYSVCCRDLSHPDDGAARVSTVFVGHLRHLVPASIVLRPSSAAYLYLYASLSLARDSSTSGVRASPRLPSQAVQHYGCRFGE